MKKYAFEREQENNNIEQSFTNLNSEEGGIYRGGFQRNTQPSNSNYGGYGNQATGPVSVHQQLKNMQMLSLLKLEISCETIIDTWRFKILSNISFAFERLKVVEINELSKNKIVKKDLQITWNLSQVFYEKITAILENKVKKNYGLGFCAIKVAQPTSSSNSNINGYPFNSNAAQDKSNSATSPHRMNSKIQNSERVDSEWDLGHSQGGTEWNENISRQNRFLKKKKEKIKANKDKMMDKFESLLSQHQAYLNMNK